MKSAIFLQRLEAVAIFLASIYFYYHLHFNFLIFVVLLFSIDIFMIGYLMNSKVGAYTYNIGHSLIAPLILLIIGVTANYRIIIGLSLIWLAHIGMDRALGSLPLT